MNQLKFNKNRFVFDNNKEYNYKILIYPNITYQNNIEADSFIIVIKNIIANLRKDIHWTLLTPKHIHSLNFDNVEQRILELPTYPNAMRTHFNVFDLEKVISWKTDDFDIVYSHLPEHTLQLANFFRNKTNIRPRIIGYCHWFEVEENTNYDKTMFLANIIGILEMEECGVNSVWLKDLVIKEAKKYFNKDIIEALRAIIQPHYLGIDKIDKGKPTPKTILFNHRHNDYTGFGWFIKQMDKLWKKRKDFTVYTTIQDSQIKKPYLKEMYIKDRNQYLEFVKTMWVGVGCFDKYSAWSISTTDGLSMGVPYILPDKFCYPEMVGYYPLLYKEKKEFLPLLEKVLDNPDLRDETNKYLEPLLKKMLWKNTILGWFDGWRIFDFKEKKTDTYKKIVDYVKEKGFATKEDIIDFLTWGRQLEWSKFRHLMRDNKNIKLTKDGYEWVK